MTTFQRARNQEQRELRRRAILDTATGMLAEMPVGAITLNELSRRVGLAKSNVLRYFDSREAILLELLDRAWKQWIADLPDLLARAVDATGPAQTRGRQVAAALAHSLSERPVMCDLFSAQAAVLERNVSAQVAGEWKRTALGNVEATADLLRAHLPELGEAASTLSAQIVMVTGSVYLHARPSSALLAAYEADPGLEVLRMDFSPTLTDILATLLAGALVRTAAP
ncbi:TetR/AcrR family transcriptional regulator [Microbispora catharanthi]|uniref:TetR family transcriptional regulator n=1 Tax=Microbispora catharanthi TaxID=1712871 RepID=A0A5N6AWJ4_9ACTN|nr:TetR family transcriptional regulator [Microbispora catharanthi]KAB8173157.1 TetR family transcriptional regulator [Microbispora catharanthi]